MPTFNGRPMETFPWANKNIEYLVNETLGKRKTYPVEFELKQDDKPACSLSSPLPKLHKKITKKVQRFVLIGVLKNLSDS